MHRQQRGGLLLARWLTMTIMIGTAACGGPSASIPQATGPGKTDGESPWTRQAEPEAVDPHVPVVNPIPSSWWSNLVPINGKSHLDGVLQLFGPRKNNTNDDFAPYRFVRRLVGCRVHRETEPEGRRYLLIEHYSGPAQGDWRDSFEENGFLFEVLFRDPSGERIFGISPILRILPEQHPLSEAPNRFGARTAMIYLAGIRNEQLAADIKRMPLTLLCRLAQWNAVVDVPSTAEKLPALPGYVQIVPNNNGYLDGFKGVPDKSAARTFAANLWLAYQAGVEQLEVITHSNGVISAHRGYQYFIDDLDGGGGSRYREQRQTPAPMQIRFIHLQAAARKAKDLLPLDRPRYFSRDDLSVGFQFYYNAGDKLTFGGSAVGSRRSAPWVAEIKRTYPSVRAEQLIIGDDRAFSEYGRHRRSYSTDPGGHEQRGVLEWFSDRRYDERWEPDPAVQEIGGF